MEAENSILSGFDGLSAPYSVIVIDPPWPIEKIIKHVRPNQVNMDYPMMTMEDIAGLPVGDLGANPSTIFVWTIDKYLYDTRAILEGWGFKYHLTMAWDKTNGMSMFGFNRRTEFVLVGFKGTHDAYPDGPTIRSSFTAPSIKGAHSRKPPVLMDMIERTLPGPYVEIFARIARPGWDAWGNQLSEIRYGVQESLLA